MCSGVCRVNPCAVRSFPRASSHEPLSYPRRSWLLHEISTGDEVVAKLLLLLFILKLLTIIVIIIIILIIIIIITTTPVLLSQCLPGQ